MRSGPDTATLAHVVIEGDLMSVRQGLLALAEAVPLRQLSDADRGSAELVLGEALNNIVEHAYAEGPGPIELWLDAGADGLAFTITDRGLAMPGAVAPEGRLPAGLDGPLADLPEGGFGWFLIRSLTRDLRYERSDGLNRLRFILPLTAQAC